jgi:hypothetical protein
MGTLAGAALLLTASLPWLAPRDDAFAAESKAASDEDLFEKMVANAGCYVCHTTFVHEELSKVHLDAGTKCVDCHGLSAGHANDEDIGATPPDVKYARNEIDAACRKCHKGHKVAARTVIARWIERRPPAPAVCTDCHGTHRIADADEEKDEAGQDKKFGE